jgi:hypothetical protein
MFPSAFLSRVLLSFLYFSASHLRSSRYPNMPSSANPRILLRPTNFLPSLGKLYPKKNIVEYCDRKGDEHPKNNPEKKCKDAVC